MMMTDNDSKASATEAMRMANTTASNITHVTDTTSDNTHTVHSDDTNHKAATMLMTLMPQETDSDVPMRTMTLNDLETDTTDPAKSSPTVMPSLIPRMIANAAAAAATADVVGPHVSAPSSLPEDSNMTSKEVNITVPMPHNDDNNSFAASETVTEIAEKNAPKTVQVTQKPSSLPFKIKANPAVRFLMGRKAEKPETEKDPPPPSPVLKAATKDSAFMRLMSPRMGPVTPKPKISASSMPSPRLSAQSAPPPGSPRLYSLLGPYDRDRAQSSQSGSTASAMIKGPLKIKSTSASRVIGSPRLLPREPPVGSPRIAALSGKLPPSSGGSGSRPSSPKMAPMGSPRIRASGASKILGSPVLQPTPAPTAGDSSHARPMPSPRIQASAASVKISSPALRPLSVPKSPKVNALLGSPRIKAMSSPMSRPLSSPVLLSQRSDVPPGSPRIRASSASQIIGSPRLQPSIAPSVHRHLHPASQLKQQQQQQQRQSPAWFPSPRLRPTPASTVIGSSSRIKVTNAADLDDAENGVSTTSAPLTSGSRGFAAVKAAANSFVSALSSSAPGFFGRKDTAKAAPRIHVKPSTIIATGDKANKGMSHAPLSRHGSDTAGDGNTLPLPTPSPRLSSVSTPSVKEDSVEQRSMRGLATVAPRISQGLWKDNEEVAFLKTAVGEDERKLMDIAQRQSRLEKDLEHMTSGYHHILEQIQEDGGDGQNVRSKKGSLQHDKADWETRIHETKVELTELSKSKEKISREMEAKLAKLKIVDDNVSSGKCESAVKSCGSPRMAPRLAPRISASLASATATVTVTASNTTATHMPTPSTSSALSLSLPLPLPSSSSALSSSSSSLKTVCQEEEEDGGEKDVNI